LRIAVTDAWYCATRFSSERRHLNQDAVDQAAGASRHRSILGSFTRSAGAFRQTGKCGDAQTR
jgi:hypothetical protein